MQHRKQKNYETQIKRVPQENRAVNSCIPLHSVTFIPFDRGTEAYLALLATDAK